MNFGYLSGFRQFIRTTASPATKRSNALTPHIMNTSLTTSVGFRREYIKTIIILFIILMTCLTDAHSKPGDGNPGNLKFIAANQPTATKDGHAGRNEYDRLNDEYKDLSIHELFVIADSIDKRNDQQEKALMMFRLIASRYSDDITDAEKVDCATAWTILGWYYIFDRKNPTQAYPYFREALEIADKHDTDGMLSCSILTNLGEIYVSFNDISNAMLNYKKAFAKAIELNNGKALEFSYADIIHFAWLSDNLHEIETESNVMASREKPTVSIGKYAMLMAKAHSAMSQGKRSMAIQLTDSAMSSMSNVRGKNRLIIENRLIAAKIRLQNGNFSEARDDLATADSIIRADDLSQLLHLLLEIKKDYYLVVGDNANATLCESRNLFVRDSLFNSQKYGVIRDMESSWQASKFEYDLIRSQRETQRHIWINIILGASMAVICVLLIWIIKKNKSLNLKNSSLFRKNMELMQFQKSEGKIDMESTCSLQLDSASPETECKSESEDCHTERESSTRHHGHDIADVFAKVKRSVTEGRDIFDPDFNIDTLARITGIRAKVISHAINSVSGKNFSTFVAEHRIHEACSLLLDKSGHQRPTIEAVAEAVGYRSRTHFSRVFKSVTGLTTTEFIRQADSVEERNT